MTTTGHDLILQEVTFAYGPHSDPVLRDLSLTIPAGDHLAIVGPSGIGKSTLASLLCGLREPTSGTVRVGDLLAVEVPPERMAEIRTLIPQEAYVFAGTVWDNLTYLCSTATARQVDNAAAALGAEALIAKLGGVSAEVAPSELSAGERQLVALVRSYISPAPLAVLDEATCHLDPVTERRVEEAFAARRGTLVVIAHRVSSALRARRILVLDATTATVGDHETLLATSSLYRELLGHWQAGPLPAPEPVGAGAGAAASRNGGSAAPASGALPVAWRPYRDDGPAPAAPGPGADTDRAPTWIFGEVSASGTGPVQGATLTLTNLAGRQVDRAVSDAGGHYRLRPPAGGSYLVICTSDGHQPMAETVVVAQVPVRHDVVLAGGRATLSGWVSTAEEGEPVADAVVTLVDGHGDVVTVMTTGPDGLFEFAELARGHYTVTVAAPPRRPVAHGVEVPGSGRVTQDVPMASRVRLSGVVRSATAGLPVAEALATLVAADGRVVGSVLTDEQGGFVFDDLAAGEYTVTATGYPLRTTPVSLRPGATAETVITLHPPGVAAGELPAR